MIVGKASHTQPVVAVVEVDGNSSGDNSSGSGFK